MSFLYKQTIIKLTTAQLERILEETNLASLPTIDVVSLGKKEPRPSNSTNDMVP